MTHCSVMGSLPSAASAPVRKTPLLLSHFHVKTIGLPRQARDKNKKTSKKGRRLSFAGLQQLLRSLRSVHSSALRGIDYRKYDNGSHAESANAPLLATHPAVRTHPETGEVALYLDAILFRKTRTFAKTGSGQA